MAPGLYIHAYRLYLAHVERTQQVRNLKIAGVDTEIVETSIVDLPDNTYYCNRCGTRMWGVGLSKVGGKGIFCLSCYVALAKKESSKEKEKKRKE